MHLGADLPPDLLVFVDAGVCGSPVGDALLLELAEAIEGAFLVGVHLGDLALADVPDGLEVGAGAAFPSLGDPSVPEGHGIGFDVACVVVVPAVDLPGLEVLLAAGVEAEESTGVGDGLGTCLVGSGAGGVVEEEFDLLIDRSRE